MGNFAIILAAGLGTRLGAPKAFLPLDGKPMLLYSLEAFERSSLVHALGIVCRKEDVEKAQNLARSASIKKLRFVVPGGKERQDSVTLGMEAIPKGFDFVAVHDAARPLITVDLIDAVFRTAMEKGAALSAIPVKDTIKIAKEARVKETLERSMLWSAQTPQCFKAELLLKGLEKARKEDFLGTDCASLVENLGVPVYLVPGTTENFKVTTAGDVLMAETLLKRLHV